MEDGNFDVVVIGTGLTESIVAAALSKAGFMVAHIDENPYYGADEASLSLDEFVEWADKHSSSEAIPTSRFTSAVRSTTVPPQSRHYSICLCPSVIPSLGAHISSLVSSGVSKYSGFRLLERLCVYSSPGVIKNVPGSKEDIIKNTDISLIEKRRLMRFLMFATGDFEDKTELQGKHDMPFLEFLTTVFSLSNTTSKIVAYSLAFCITSMDTTLLALQRLRRYLRSIGRHGPSPFLIGHYGGIGDVAQGFCRASAVNGGVYILGRKLTAPIEYLQESDSADGSSTSKSTSRYIVKLEDLPEPLTCRVLISPSSHVLPHLLQAHLLQEAKQLKPSPTYNNTPAVDAIARCVAIIDQRIAFSTAAKVDEDSLDTEEAISPPYQTLDESVDTAIITFPPLSLPGGSTTSSATVLITGEGSMSAPKGKWIVYIWLPILTMSLESPLPQTILQPYLDAICALSPDPPEHPLIPLFTTFYIEHPRKLLPSSPELSTNDGLSTCIIPASIPFCPLPDIPDAATEHAEAVFREAVNSLRNGRQSKDSETDGTGSETVDFWPPLEPEEESEDE